MGYNQDKEEKKIETSEMKKLTKSLKYNKDKDKKKIEISEMKKVAKSLGGNQAKDKKKIEISEMTKLIKSIEGAKGNGPSMISIIMPPRDQISRVSKMLADEYETASNIKSKATQQSVLKAIANAQESLKLYNGKVPPNGLVLYSGAIVDNQGKPKKITVDFEPLRPINMSLYRCDNKFHTQALNEFLESDDDKFGFIVMDGNGALFGTLSGNTSDVLHKFSVDLPRKQGRGGGGQSAIQLERLRIENRQNYLRKAAELATQYYINASTNKPNVAGLILAGSAEFKNELSRSDLFDRRLVEKVVNVVNVSHGGEAGFEEAIKQSSEIMANMKFAQEERLIGKFFEETRQKTGKYVCGVDDTVKALELGAVETLIVWENLDINRYVMKKSVTGETVIKHLNKEQEGNANNFRKLDVEDKMSLVAWLANEYTGFGCTLEFVTNQSEEAATFCKGFGGIGGILRYQLDVGALNDYDDKS